MAVFQAFRASVWTLVELVDTLVRSGHFYLEISERDQNDVVVAKASATPVLNSFLQGAPLRYAQTQPSGSNVCTNT